MDDEAYFSDDYRSSRKRFREAAKRAGAKLDKLHWGLRGPSGEKLSIDVALLGAKNPERVLVHSSGVHGVEGFAGSAIQLKVLENPPDPGPDGAIALIHCVNPYGMAHLRRVNESNVDLNRNFLRRKEWRRAGAHEGYHILHPILNPTRKELIDLFTLRLLWKTLRHGFEYLKQAGGQGQYIYPHGLFFGGMGLEAGPQLLMRWLKKRLKRARHICAIDVHTGAGEPGEDWLIIERNRGGAFHQRLEPLYGAKRIDTPDGQSGRAYVTTGGLDAGIVRAVRGIKGAVVDFVTQEFGTVGGRQLLSALREENRQFHQGADDPAHPARQYLKNCFTPQDARWRRAALTGGLRLVEETARFLFDDAHPPLTLQPDSRR